MKSAKIIVLLTLFLFIYLCPSAVNPVYQEYLKFRIVSPNNKILTEKNFSGKMTLINFGTLNSEASLKEKILLQEFINENKTLDVNYIPILLGKKQQVDSFVANNKFSYEFYRDPQNILRDSLKVNIVPSSFILNEEGILIYRHVGILDFTNLRDIFLLLNKNSREIFNDEQ